MKPIYLLFTIGFIANISQAQIEFRHEKSLLGDLTTRSAISLAITDVNGDYKDDIILLDKGQRLITACQNGKGITFSSTDHGIVLDNPAWALSVGDTDNDGIAEIFTAGISTFGRLFKQNASGQYQYVQQLFGMSFPQNSNFADINNDGWLDLFVCDEVGYNDIYLNNGEGGLFYNDFIDFKTVLPSDNSGNYGSEWVDFDDDGDLDLFITKCKPVAVNPKDPRRINALYVNDGTNTYSEKAAEFGLNSSAQSWTGTFGDIDNDGDLDCFVSNHDTIHFLYRNYGNELFIDETDQLISPGGFFSMQVAIRDFDNNGFNDILISGQKNYLYWNMGNDQWVLEQNPFGPIPVFSYATGDLNDDGFLDIVASYAVLNSPGQYDDRIYLNNGNENHYLKISLSGITSNSRGIGAKVKAFSALGIQVQDAKIGESYGTTNSSNLHFGLGQLIAVDSIHIRWPSGITDKYYDIPANQHLLAVEGLCMKPFFNILPQQDIVLCHGEATTLSIPLDLENIHWSNGATAQSLIVNNDAQLSVSGYEPDGCLRVSNIKSVLLDPDQTPEISFLEGSAVNCPGTSVVLTSGAAKAYLWNTGQTDVTIQVSQSGSYHLTITGDCKEFVSDTLQIEFVHPELPLLDQETIYIPEAQYLTLHASGDSILWFRDANNQELLHTGNSFNTSLIDRDTSFYVAGLSRYYGPSEHVGKLVHQGTPYSGNNINSGLIFTVFEEIVLDKLRVYTQHNGYRTIELKHTDDSTNVQSTIYSKRVFIDSQTKYIDLGFEILPGKNYLLTTNPDSNLVHQGVMSPRLYRSSTGANFPYTLKDVLEISTTAHGPANYYYFYDWQVRQKQAECLSNSIPVFIFLETSGLIRDDTGKEFKIKVFPNPVTSELRLQFHENYKDDIHKIEIVNILGQTVKTIDREVQERILIEDMKPGLYFILVETGISKRRVLSEKFIIK